MQPKIKIALAIFVALIAVSTTYAISQKNKPIKKTTQEEIQEIVHSALQKSLKNPNSEVIKAWEDSITKNQPEINQLLNGTSTDTATTTNIEQKPTATDLFSRDLFTKYMEAKQSGKAIDGQVQQDIVDAILGKTYITEDAPYDGKGLTIIENTNQNLRLYGNTVSKIVQEPLPPSAEHELVYFDKFARGELTDADLQLVALLEQRYKTMRERVLKISIPKDIEKYHVKLIIGIDGKITALHALSEMNNDPIGSIAKIGKYEDAVGSVNAWTMGIKSVFIENNVSFKQDEAGSFLME
jgi:hypothetical protein